MNHEKFVKRQRQRRGLRVRRRLRGKMGEPIRPRLSIFRSHKHIYAQVIDDNAGKTLAAASTRDKEVAAGYGGNRDAAASVGKAVAQRALAAGVKEVTFDRRSYKYHGRVAALANAAREEGLSF